MKFNDKSFFDYLDGIMSSKNIYEFEKYIEQNANARNKLNSLKESEYNLKNIIVDDKIAKNVPNDLLLRINQIGKKMDDLEESKAGKINSFIMNIFKPLIEIPIQTKGFIAAFCIFMFFIGNGNIIIPGIDNKNEKDLLLKISNLNKQTFNSVNDKGEIKKFNIDNYNFIIEDISKSSMTRGFNITNTENHCKESMDTKTTEIVLEGDRKNKKIYTYCGNEENNTWELFKIEIPKDYQPIEIQGNYKIKFDNEKIILFPNN